MFTPTRMSPSSRSRSPASSISTAAQCLPITRARHSPSWSNDSTESLRHLELTDGSMKASTISRHTRTRSSSLSGFDFQAGLLPPSEAISETGLSFRETRRTEKTIGLVHGTRFCCPFRCDFVGRSCARYGVDRWVPGVWCSCVGIRRIYS